MIEADFNADHTLDCRGLNCPQPVLKLKKKMMLVAPGQTVLVICTDELSVIDIPHFAATTGIEVKASSANAGEFFFLIEK
ncbi:MAG: sulfurtransferase TusA family protein [Sulfuritalea sp.]|nr:sulfurtransferase TusA family protein [Sulfuritalea sp.]